QQSQSGQAINPSAIASLMLFSQQLKSLEGTVKTQNQKIKQQKEDLERLEQSINGKATKFSVNKVAAQLRNNYDGLTQDLSMRKREIEMYRKKMNLLETMITNVELEYSEVEMKADALRDLFDGLSTKCRRVKTGWKGRANGEIMFLDRHHLKCRTNEFLHSFLLARRSDYELGKIRYVYECCKYNI
ncbi:hypothetical protein QZH41_008955, partial [Actinostola sp. cb2023]